MPAPKRSEDAQFLTLTMAMGRLNLCRSSTLRLARESKALFRCGKSWRINWVKLNDYIETECIK